MELTGFIKIVASLGVPGLVVGIIYWMLRVWGVRVSRVPASQAAIVVIAIIAVIGGLTYSIITRVFPEAIAQPPATVADRDLRFETRYEEAKFYPLDADKIRGDFVVRFVPTTTNNDEAATIFVGMAKIHDDEKVDDVTAFAKSTKRCDESPSCLHPPLVWNWVPPDEKIVRGATDGTRYTFSAVFDRRVKRLLVQWEFYQREGDNGARCEVDATRPKPLDGLPFLHSVKNGKPLYNWCYRAWERKVIPVALGV